MTPVRAWTQTTWSGVERTNDEADALLSNYTFNHSYFIVVLCCYSTAWLQVELFILSLSSALLACD